jgi:hypothetical protein
MCGERLALQLGAAVATPLRAGFSYYSRRISEMR